MQHLEKQESGESGFGVQLIFAAMMSTLLLKYFFDKNHLFTMRARQNIQQKLTEENMSRKIDQLLSDDEYCTKTNLIENLNGINLAGVSQKVELSSFEQLNHKQGEFSKAVLAKSKETHLIINRHNVALDATKTIDKVTVEQMPGPPRMNIINGITVYRIPATVNQYGSWDELDATGENLTRRVGNLGTWSLYIEMDHTDPTIPLSCYAAISSRSLCLDAGSIFDPLAPVKCTRF